MITHNSLVAENCLKIRIDDYVRQVRNSLKKVIIEAQINVNGDNIKLCESNTRFGGSRLWFECPLCKRRREILYINSTGKKIVCRKCIRLNYK